MPFLKWSIIFTLLMDILSLSHAAVEPKMIIGYESGELKRCKLSNVNSCKTLSIQDSPISSLAVAGEFIYVGLQSGELRRCPQFRSSNCTTFHQKEYEINAIAIFGQSVFLAQNNTITKCGLRKSEDCELFYESDTPIYSLLGFKGILYAGSDSFVLNCSPDVSLNCTVISNTTSAVNALTASGQNVYLGLKDGAVETCEINNITDCFPLFLTESEIKDIDIIDNFILTSLNSGDILRYDIDVDETSKITVNSSKPVLSMSVVYHTTPVHRHYIGESASCVWQFTSCPPYVVYYDVQSRAALELHVKDGLIYDTNGYMFDTDDSDMGHWRSGAIFVMDSAGRIFASNQHPIGLLHHSSLLSGKPAAAAGEVHVSEGIIKTISTCSGHYRPSIQLSKQILSSLKKQGYDRNVTLIDCGFMRKDLMIDLDFKKTDLYYRAKYEKYSRKMKKINEKNYQIPTSIIF